MKDHIDIANSKTSDQFITDYLPSSNQWRSWIHPATKAEYQITLQTAETLPKTNFDACFNLIECTSGEAYRKSKDGWKPRSKRKEMRLLDLKYLLVKLDDQVEGFLSFMPTYEDEYPVIYCYEIHLSPALQGSGLGRVLMQYLEVIGDKIPGTAKVMLTCFLSNTRGVAFYQKLGYAEDEFSPQPKILRNGTKVAADYVIMSKNISR
ncbi:uncharacterized protein LY89DRAFT_571810 [Mollisia scopiformis]|uniref:N-alpha-acetyltransferase 40 n=1 Tax=Mollisia scopiformis TaxID=149040 RepID=A0A194XV24_MOLSC|nr:uncharacterized protein LY89DRAFT_571810 [Mollisia scopiformis]KUJ23884.1 hypothetical protein LY89DRAFT_571810 [Mollisia scopiformis]